MALRLLMVWALLLDLTGSKMSFLKLEPVSKFIMHCHSFTRSVMYVEYSENLGYISDWLNHDCPLHVLQVRSPTPTESHRPTTSPLSSQDILSPTSDEVQF